MNGRNLHNARGAAERASYDPLSKALHWATVILVLATYAVTLWPELVSGSSALHRSLGLALLVVVPLRLCWRLSRGSGGTKPGNGLGGLAAKAMHLALYGLLLALPVLGWLYLNLKGNDVSVFGFALPTLTEPDRQLATLVFQMKWWLSYGMLGAIGLHAAAALAHHYLLRDGVLTAMLPNLPRPQPTGPSEAFEVPFPAALPWSATSAGTSKPS